jgi:polyhydroxybutyrate depolymerase
MRFVLPSLGLLLPVCLVLVAASACSSSDSTPGSLTSPDGSVLDEDGGIIGPDGSVTPKPDGGVTAQVKITNETLMVDGTQRSYVLIVPTAYSAAKSYPLVLSLHGQPGSATGHHQYVPFENASGDDAIVAYPDGLDGEWDLYPLTANNPDMKFIRDMVDDLATKYSIDKSRVFGTGYSNGAFMVNQMACRYAGFFKGITAHAGGAPDEPNVASPARYGSNGCLQCPGGPTPAIIFHGDPDNTVSTAGGLYSARCWATNNGCQDQDPPTTAVAPSPCAKFDGCPAGKEVRWCAIPGIGHVQWSPQGDQVSWAFFKGL